MKIGEEFKGCRYWGYEPASAEFLHKPMPRKQKDQLRDKNNADRRAIKAAGFQPNSMGFVSQMAARIRASKIERATNIEMHVFNHDYL